MPENEINITLDKHGVSDVKMPSKTKVTVYNYDYSDWDKDEKGVSCRIKIFSRLAYKPSGKYDNTIQYEAIVRIKNKKITDLKHTRGVKVLINDAPI